MKNISRLELENIYGKISPFEFKNKLIELATLSNRKSTRTLLDAGRGNPNWIASTPREAFFTFGQFAITESRYTWDDGDLTGMPKKTGIYKRFCTYVENNKFMPGIDTLKAIIDYGIEELNFDKDEFLHELTDAIIGDNYPFPDRMLIHIEKIVKEYLKREMKYDVEKGGEFNVFAVEGATAAMCYIFDSLIANNLLLKGDKIAIIAEDDFVKTALFNILCGKDKDYKGMIEWGKTINYGYLPQDNTEYFNTDKNIMEWIGQFYDIKDETVLRGFLGRMLFSGEDVFKKVNVLSGGEKARCMLSKMMLEEPNFLVLDEPTNHLDLESIMSLNKGMEKFTGEIIFTTRDYELNSTVANRIIEIGKDGSIIDRPCTYEEYIDKK